MRVRIRCRWLHTVPVIRGFLIVCVASTVVLLFIHLTVPNGIRRSKSYHGNSSSRVSRENLAETQRVQAAPTTQGSKWQSQRPRCQEQQNIVFLKVHKTGSSTVANILQRFGLSRHLNFALPKKKPGNLRYNYFGDIGETLHEDGIVASRNSSRYNILYNHVIFNVDAFEKIFAEGTVYVTLIREPLEQFMSAVLYFLNEKIYNVATTDIRDYMKHPEKYEPKDPYLSFTNNRQSLDLGMNTNILRDDYFIEEYLYLLDYKLDLVMITEYFDESLVLLKRRMCWSVKDILYMRKNPRYKSFEFKLTPTDKHLHKQHTKADYMLYDRFLKRFYERMKNETHFGEEVLFFKGVLKRMNWFCEGNEKFTVLKIDDTRWSPAFNVTSLDCAYMRLGTLAFLDKLYHDRQI